MFTYALARRLAGTGVTARPLLHPGVVCAPTSAFEDQSRYFAGAAAAGPAAAEVHRARGAAPPIYLASSADVEGRERAVLRQP
jgi:hypothetical protein